MTRINFILRVAVVFLAILLSACASKEGSDGTAPTNNPAPIEYQVTVAVSQLSNAGALVLTSTDSNEQLTINDDGSITFTTKFAESATFNLVIDDEPINKDCVFDSKPDLTISSNGKTVSGSMVAASDIGITCADLFAIGGSVAGLEAGNSLQLGITANGTQEIIDVATNSLFTFSTFYVTATTYSVNIETQPANQNCVINNVNGQIDAADIGNIVVQCAPSVVPAFSVGGSVSGLASNSTNLTLQIVGGQTLTKNSNGPFTFSAVTAGTYTVTLTNPTSPTQDCNFANNTKSQSITVLDSDITPLAVSCVTTTFSIGGNITGLTGQNLVITNTNNNDQVTVNNGANSFTLGTEVIDGVYTLQLTNPTNPVQNCTFNFTGGAPNSDGTTRLVTINGNNKINANITCVTNLSNISGNVTGLDGSGLSVQISDGGGVIATQNPAPGGASVSYVFTALPDGAYTLNIANNPSAPLQTCTFNSNSTNSVTQTISGSNIGSINISCVTDQFAVGVDVTGLTTGGSFGVSLTSGAINASLPINSTGITNFTPQLDDQSSYTIDITSQPAGQTCSFAGNSQSQGATVVAAPVVAAINCDNNVVISGAILGLIDNTYSVQFTIVGGTGPGSQINQQTTVNGNAAFTFGDLPPNTDYTITMTTPIADHTCSFNNGGGVNSTIAVLLADVPGQDVTCTTTKVSLTGLFTDTALQACIDLLGLTYANEVTTLDCSASGTPIQSLAGMENLINLNSVVLDNNAITSVSQLTALPQLSQLHLTNNLISDAAIADLSVMPALTDLNLANVNPASANQNTISQVNINTNLLLLNLTNNAVSSLQNVGLMANLTQLQLAGNQLDTTAVPPTDLSLLAGLSQLTYLDISGNNISDVAPLASLVQLQSLLIQSSTADLVNVASFETAFVAPPTLIDLSGNPTMVCADLDLLIAAYPVGVVVPAPSIAGTNCTIPPIQEFTVSGVITSPDWTASSTLSPALVLTLQSNGVDLITATINDTGTGNIPFIFGATVPSGNTYQVIVSVQPSSGNNDYDCTVVPVGATTITANVTNVAVNCPELN